MDKRYSLIIFDWDGTLIDSVPTITRSLAIAAEQMGLPQLDEVAYKSVIGLSLTNAIRKLYPTLADEQLQRFIKQYREEYNRLEKQPSVPFPGVTNGLNVLREQGITMAVATGKGRNGLDRSMTANQYHEYFQASRCADETRSKPDPLMLEQLLEELDIPVEQALMVGDAGFDLQMAESLGMDRVAVTYGAQPKEKLLSHDPVFVADSFDDLIEWVGIVEHG
ncbi:HAD family hydrolase [Endozoicomonas lisbonensis]|uniref:Phosphoglycolate phosphatase n=1 Tax=Endozoicomonas lisbonensis TaxID=3120522 RepID=A0ABV2SLZ8_9GAMM